VKLFDIDDPKTFRGSYSFPFVNIGDGYLEFDSSKNHVEVTRKMDSSKDGGLLKMKRYERASSEGFMPFNKINVSKGLDENGYYALSGNKNYCFGMKMEIPFVMSKGGKITTYSGKEEDMIFKISGDDDMWVYVDGELVLDLGGIHHQVEGMINFATGVVSTTGNHINDGTGLYNKEVTTVLSENTSIKKLSGGRHKLQVFYLERGSSVSNCKITVRVQEDQTPRETVAPEEDIVGPIN
jgi:fibro-slime domain-containing protein